MPDRPGLSPSQTVGPYLSIGLLRDLVTPAVVPAGTPGALTIRGRLLDGAGDPVPDGMVEIWQADAQGRYGADGFVGLGRSGTADDGWFSFTTVKPGRVPGPGGEGLQAPHLAVAVFARGILKRLATRLYFPDETEANATDPILALLAPDEREALVARAEGDGTLRFDIRLQGDGQTPFLAL